ncbi:hypothetical protein [Neorhizobium sp. DT-125]|uniref:hypothetical protein n=1 Tax=Neorhizobium sp. DT-125 TaxID=3396163 RepID=UPI003F1A232C
MTMITYQGSERSRVRPSSFASFIRPVLLIALKLRDEWRRRKTEKMLESLPTEIRKDIGWPTSDAPASRR